MEFSAAPSLGIEALGWAAVAFNLLAYGMRTMIWLRSVAMVANALFVVFAFSATIWPTFFLNLALLPFNGWRLWQILDMRRRMRVARSAPPEDDPGLVAALRPYLSDLRLKDGAHVFRKGDAPEHLYLLVSGQVRIEEAGVTLEPGAIFGEIAFFSDSRARTASARCIGDCVIACADEAAFLRAYTADPAFGLWLMRLITRRLLENADAARARPA